MEDMLRQGDLVGARLLDIIKRQIVKETDGGVIISFLKNLIPIIVKNYIPLSMYIETHSDLFEIILDKVLDSEVLCGDSTKHAVVEYALNSVRSEEHYELLVKWFEEGAIFTTSGKKLGHIELSLKHRHEVVKRIWSSINLP